MDDLVPPKRGRGRPKGSLNKAPPVFVTPMLQGPTGPYRAVPPGCEPFDDYPSADALTMVSRHYAMIDWAQQALRQELKAGLSSHREGTRVSEDGINKLVSLGKALMAQLDAHKKALAVAEELSKNKTPAELLEIAVKKIEGQDIPTLVEIIKRLRLHRRALAPLHTSERSRMGGPEEWAQPTSASAIASLESDEADQP